MFDLIYTQAHEEFRVRLEQGATIIGRSMSCDVIITEKSVSSKHARIVLIGDSLSITDLESSNGILLNGKKVPNASLRPGDKLQLGRVPIRIEESGRHNSQAPDYDLAPADDKESLQVFRPPEDGGPSDPRIAERSLRPLRRPGVKPRRGLPRLKFLLSVLILAMVGVGIYLLTTENPPVNLKKIGLINPEYNNEAYNHDLLAGLAECKKRNYAGAYSIWKETAEKWAEKNPETPKATANQLTRLIQPLAQAQVAKSYLEMDWYTFGQKAKIFLLEAGEVPKAITSFFKDFSEEAVREGQVLKLMNEALAEFDKGEYKAAAEKIGTLPASSFYSQAAAALAQKAQAARQEKLITTAYLHATVGEWGQAIELASEILKTAKNPELEADIKNWRSLQEQQGIINQAKQLIEKNTREELEHARRLLRNIPENSRLYQQAHSAAFDVSQKILNLTLEELWQEANFEALTNLAEDNPALKKDPRYLNLVKTAGDATALLAQARELEKNGDYEAAVKTWADVCRMIPEKNQRYHQQASSMLEYYTPEKMGELYRQKGVDAIARGEYKTARVSLDKANKYGLEVTADLKVLTDTARQLYTKSMNSPDEELLLLRKSRDCLLPGDPLYSKVQKRIISIQGALP